jgi:acyl-coenzyme A thioesterase PaaI-like protein
MTMNIPPVDLENFFNGSPDFSEQQEIELLRFCDAIRSIINRTIMAEGSASELSDLADQAESLDQQLEPLVSRRALPAYHRVFDFTDVGATYAYSPVTGRANPVAPPVHSFIEKETVISTVNFGNAYEGPPGCVHGGIVAMTWDHVLAAATIIDDQRGPTANLNIRYLKPTPLHHDLRFESWVDRQEGNKIFVKGRCYANDEVVTEAEGLFIHTLIKELEVTDDHLKQEIRKG